MVFPFLLTRVCDSTAPDQFRPRTTVPNVKRLFAFLSVANESYERLGISISWEDPSVGQNNRGEAGDS